MNHRPLRVGNLIRDELSQMLIREFEFPNALVTITTVEVLPNLSLATVGVSVLPASRADGVLHELRAASRRLERDVLKKINIRPMPHLTFAIDHGPANAAKIEKILLDEDPPHSGSASRSAQRD